MSAFGRPQGFIDPADGFRRRPKPDEVEQQEAEPQQESQEEDKPAQK